CNNTKDAYKLAKKIQALLTDEYNIIKDTSAGGAGIKDNNNSDDNEGIEGIEGIEDSADNESNKDSDDKDSSVSSDDFDACAEIFGQSTLASALESSFSSVITNSTTREDLGIISECPRVKAGSADWLHHTGLALKINSLTLALHNYVKARTLATSEQVDVGRRLNVKRAIRIPLGETRIWNKKTYDLDHNTSIHVLVDASSSMLSRASDGNFPDYKLTRCDHAKICAYCIAKALEGIPNTESQVTFFPAVCTKDDRNDDCGYEVGMCKQANESVQRTLKYFDQSPSGSTPMAQALAYALSKFKYSDKDRNIILIITDGMPDSIANVQRQLQQIEHLGVELRVLSINCETALKLFPNCVVTDASVLLDNANKVIKQLFN
ncbi:MAG: VWA domain-containing protein, partial [Succinivibrio sp.]|nr:VWA domain-containing protein [Succinivibrio sp.]